MSEAFNPLCPPSAPFFGFMGAAVALIFASALPPPALSVSAAPPAFRAHLSA